MKKCKICGITSEFLSERNNLCEICLKAYNIGYEQRNLDDIKNKEKFKNEENLLDEKFNKIKNFTEEDRENNVIPFQCTCGKNYWGWIDYSIHLFNNHFNKIQKDKIIKL